MAVISERRALLAGRENPSRESFAVWGAAQRLTDITAPRVRGTRNRDGGLISVRLYHFS